ncbi:MAG: hypothetical protein H0T40_12780 [Geodermatophilaceae bacterium]|nr:hypothetical protein [Geodermatophilaceae bacterium]
MSGPDDVSVALEPGQGDDGQVASVGQEGGRDVSTAVDLDLFEAENRRDWATYRACLAEDVEWVCLLERRARSR